ncbi:MAG TPA: hypothetical protein VFZ34_32045 [Blastocatellia bacterium]|nr:hypothetical protein [Blastocatellia bacterium]
MSHQLEFTKKYQFPASVTGISLPVKLQCATGEFEVEAKMDTGSEYCIFAREVGEEIGLDILSGEPQRVGSLTGGYLDIYGHDVSLITLDLKIDTKVYFCEKYEIPRNLLGRHGWLEYFQMGLIEYTQELYLSLLYGTEI